MQVSEAGACSSENQQGGDFDLGPSDGEEQGQGRVGMPGEGRVASKKTATEGTSLATSGQVILASYHPRRRKVLPGFAQRGRVLTPTSSQ